MASSIYRHLIILLAFCSCAALAGAQEESKPLTNSELLALVAGNALNENVVHEIESRSLAFRPGDGYRSQLSAAGADNLKTYGENSAGVSNSLRMVAGLYFSQNDFTKAEPILLRAVKIDETIYGHDGPMAVINLTMLCSVYDRWAKPARAAPCQAHILSILEKQYGPDNPILVSTLTSEAQALRSLGRNEEAAKTEQRIKTIQATAMNQN